MATEPVSRTKRQGNSRVPERYQKAEPDIIRLYRDSGMSVRELSRQFNIGHNSIQRMLERNGLTRRNMAEAGELRRGVGILTPIVTERTPGVSLRSQVAQSLGPEATAALIRSGKFNAHYARECRRRNIHDYRAWENERKRFLNRIPKWEKRSRIVAFLKMAHDLGLEVDHIIPLRGENVCGLNVISNFRLVRREVKQSKQNKFVCGPDSLIGLPLAA